MPILPIVIFAASGSNVSSARVNASAGGDSFENAFQTETPVFRNNSANPRTITFTAFGVCQHGFLHDQSFTIPGDTEMMLGPFTKTRFNNSSGHVVMNYSAVGGLTVYVLRHPHNVHPGEIIG